MSDQIAMTYGDYGISPVPVVSIRRNSLQARNRTNPLGYTFSMTLNGVATPLPDGNTGLPNTVALTEELRSAFNRDGKLLRITCNETPVMEIYPRIISVNFAESNNNWVDTIPYTIEIEYDYDQLDEHPDADETPPYIEGFTEDWNVEFIEDQKYFEWDLSALSNQVGGFDYTNDSNNKFEARVTHSVTVIGKQSWEGTGLTGTPVNAVDNAMAWITGVYNNLGYNSSHYGHALSGWTNLADSSGYSEYNHFRSHSVNETDGTVSLTESWIIVGNNASISGEPNRRFTEDFTVNIRRSNEDGKTAVSVDGQVTGYEQRTYSGANLDNNVSTMAYDNASYAWNVLQDRVFPRAQFIYQQDFSRILNPNPLNKTVGHQPSRGIITYNYEFDDRPCAFITGALSENFSINDTHPTDVFASLSVLGRSQGPVLQAIDTITSPTREVSIEAVMPPPSSCTSIADFDQNKPSENVRNIFCQFEEQLTDAYDQVFKSSDSESWNPINGRYSRTVSWVYGSCSGAPDTTFC